MPVNGFSVGKDVTLTLVDSTGTPVPLNLITKFTAKEDSTDKKIKGLDGLTRHLKFLDGWSGSFEIARQDGTLDDYFAVLEAGYYLGLPQGTSTISETISEPDGTVSQYLYSGVLLKLEDAGDWAGDSEVKQKLSFMASRRTKVA